MKFSELPNFKAFKFLDNGCVYLKLNSSKYMLLDYVYSDVQSSLTIASKSTPVIRVNHAR